MTVQKLLIKNVLLTKYIEKYGLWNKLWARFTFATLYSSSILAIYSGQSSITTLTENIKEDSSLDPEIVYTVHGDCTIKTVMYGAPLHVRPLHVSIHVEVNGVPPQAERLPTMFHLHVWEVSNSLFLERE